MTLHQKNPGFNVVSNEGNPYLTIGDVDTAFRKYGLEVGNGDPGEPPLFDNGDYSEWSVGFATDVAPADFYTSFGAYQTETGTHSYRIWNIVAVPDDYVLPSEYINYGFSLSAIARAALDDARKFILLLAKAEGVPLVSIYNTINKPVGLYNVIANHMNTQFDLIAKVSTGQISLDAFEQQSNQASQNFVLDLGSQAGIHKTLVEIARQVISTHVVTTNPSDDRYATSTADNGTAGFLPPGVKAFHVLGSPSSESLGGSDYSGDVVIAGPGDDVVRGGKGSDILLGGLGVDTVSYSLVDDVGLSISLEQKVASASNGTFSDKILGFENASGSQKSDTIVGAADNNTLRGEAGDDRLFGRAGNDILQGGLGADQLDGGDGSDTAAYDEVEYSYGPSGSITILGIRASLLDPTKNTRAAAGDSYTSVENLYGTIGKDSLTGDNGNNTLWGNGDDDLLAGEGGDDKLYGGLGSDSVHGGSGSDTLFGESGNDLLFGEEGTDVLYGGDGYDTAYYSGPSNAFHWSRSGDGSWTVTDTRPGMEGTDTLYGIEALSFDDRTYGLPNSLDADDIFRFYNTNTKTHFYTNSDSERDFILANYKSYKYEGNAFDTTATADTGVGVYRFYNTKTKTHFYTANVSERDFIQSHYVSYKYEGVAYYAYSDSANGAHIPLHRFYNTQTKTHFFTANSNEQQYVASHYQNYKYEGIAYYVDLA